MLKHTRISKYKIKKILTCFVEDYSATKTAETVKINRNTVNRYYKIFRKIIKLLLIELILKYSPNAEYLGYIKQDYGQKKYIDIYQYHKDFALFTLLDKKPNHKKHAMDLVNYDQFRRFVYTRLSRFYGFNSKKSYQDQLIECAIRHYYDKETLHSKICTKLATTTEKIY